MTTEGVLWWHQGCSGSCMLGGGASNGSDLLQHVLQMLDRFGIWGIWRPGQHLGPFYCVPLSSVCGVSGLIVLLGHQVVLMWWVGLVWLGQWWIPARHEGCQASDHIWRHHWICLIRPQDNLQPCLWQPKKVFQARTWLFPCTAQRSHNMRLKTEATETRRCNTIHINVQPRRQLSKSKCYTFCIHVVTRGLKTPTVCRCACVTTWQRAATFKKKKTTAESDGWQTSTASHCDAAQTVVFTIHIFIWILINVPVPSVGDLASPGFRKKMGLFTLSAEV